MFQALDEELALCGNSLKQQGEISGQVGPPPGVEGLRVGWLQLCGFSPLLITQKLQTSDSPFTFISSRKI